MEVMKVLWLRPSMGDHISVRRTRIAEHLANLGVEADIEDVSGLDSISGVWKALTGDYDIILGNVRMGLYLGYPLSVLLDKPFVGDVSDPISDIEDLPRPLFEFFHWYEWHVLSRADACVFTYESTFEEAKRRGIDGLKLPNAVDYDRFADPDEQAIAEAADILDAAGVDREKQIAMYIGGFTDTYHLEDIVAAAQKNPQWEFVFVGQGPKQSFIDDSASEIANVYFPGAFEYRLMPGFLSHATVGFCFKDAEQPLKLAEYGAAGLVAIAQPGALSERFADDEVYFVEPSESDISTALEEISSSPELRETYGQNLRERAKEVSWQEVAREYHQMLMELQKRGE